MNRLLFIAIVCLVELSRSVRALYRHASGGVTVPTPFGRSSAWNNKSRRASRAPSNNHHYPQGLYNDDQENTVQNCSNNIGMVLLRGAALRIASDLSGGTVLETIKTRTTTTTENPIQATRHIVKTGGVLSLWKGTPSRTVEGALIGAVFMLASTITKAQCKRLGLPPTVSALAAGLVGGVAQATVMTPAGLIFTALNGDDSGRDTMTVIRDVLQQKGIAGMYAGSLPMCIRQATNWASRAGFTEITRTAFGLSKYGIMGELASGCIGGVGSCWNTPIETIRVYTHRDVSQNKTPKDMKTYWNEIYRELTMGPVGFLVPGIPKDKDLASNEKGPLSDSQKPGEQHTGESTQKIPLSVTSSSCSIL